MPRLSSSPGPLSDQEEFRSNDNFTSRVNDSIRDRLASFNNLGQQILEWYQKQSLLRRIMIIIGGILGGFTMIMLLVFHVFIIKFLVWLSDKWQEFTFGKAILFSLVFMVGFPPLIGFSALSMLTGMVYGFRYGFPLLATASITGSFCSFLVFRYLLHNQAERLVNSNKKFRAFAEILRDDSSLLLLVLLRLCPLPYSLSNGALAAIPELPALTYFLASLITSPKLLIHIFVGHKLKELGDVTKGKSTKFIDVISILITVAASSITTYIIYNKMQQKLESYRHRSGIQGDGYESMVFGNFEEDIESANNVELNSADFDADNFIIEDEDEDEYDITKDNGHILPKDKKHKNTTSLKVNEEFDISGDADDLDLDEPAKKYTKNTKGFRNY